MRPPPFLRDVIFPPAPGEPAQPSALQGQGGLTRWQPQQLNSAPIDARGFSPLIGGSPQIPPGGTLCLASLSTGTVFGTLIVSAPYGPSGGLQDLLLPWVPRGQAIPLPWGGAVTLQLQVNGPLGTTAQVSIDWHPGEPVEWTVPIALDTTLVALPPWSVDLVWVPDDGLLTQLQGAAAFNVGAAQTPGQVVTLAPGATGVQTTVGAAQLSVRCRR